jgi:serine/threonine protein kinase
MHHSVIAIEGELCCSSVTTKPPFDPASLPAGTRLVNKYEIVQPIGWGEYSVVYLALHALLRRKAAVKVLAYTDELTMKRFSREARLGGSLRHPNIIEVYEVGTLPDGRPFLAMEYLEGETAAERFTTRGPFPVAEALHIGRAVLAGLAVAHENRIVHRDLRPENIFLARVRNEEVVKILDFGISRRFGSANDSTITTPGTLLGDIGYLAPEQLAMNVVVDQRTDLYAVGVLLYRMLTGRMPFNAKGPYQLIEIVDKVPEAPSSIRSDLPRELDRVILCALEKKPEYRFQDAEKMDEALRMVTYATGAGRGR